MKNIKPKKTRMDGNTDKWDCVEDPWDYRQFPVLILSNGPIYMTWELAPRRGRIVPFMTAILSYQLVIVILKQYSFNS
jgi:hypothetical protein